MLLLNFHNNTISNSNKYKFVQPEICNFIISSNFYITEEGKKVSD